MIVDVVKIDEAIKRGISSVCAWCEHFWTVHDQDRNEWRCGKNCGGPISHMAFPAYKGPKENHIQDMCFVCGGVPDGLVDILGKGMLGVCSNHMDKLKLMLNSKIGTRINIEEKKVVNIGEFLTNGEMQ